jgi:uncharacterized membrane protein YbhN (UPF0104 family)
MITATIPVQMPTIETDSSTRQQNITSARRSGGFARAARVAIAAGLTALLLWQSDPKAVWQAARNADWRFIVLACVLVAIDRVLMAYRWWTLLAPLDGPGRPEGRHYDNAARSRLEGRDYDNAAHSRLESQHYENSARGADLQVAPNNSTRSADLQVGPGGAGQVGRRPPLGTVMRIFFVSTFVGTFLPASVGGDAVRAYGLSKEGVQGVAAVASVLMDRLLGVISILIVAIAGAILARDLIDIRALFPALALLMVLCAVALTVVFSPRAAIAVARLLAFLPRGRDTGTRLVTAIQRYATLHLPLGVYFALVPIVLLIVLMPITINGIGTTQAGFMWLFGRAGVASAPAFALSVLFLAIAVVGNLPGGLLYLFGGKRAS